MEAAFVGVGTGAMKPLLSKLSKLLQEEYGKLKRVSREVESTRDEMGRMEDALGMLADVEQLNPMMRAWRDDVREISYDMEDCVDDFMARVEHKHDGSTRLKKFFGKIFDLRPRHQIASKISALKARAIEANDRHKRYYQFDSLSLDSTCDIDPRLHVLYVTVGKLVGIDGPKEDIIEWFNKETSTQLQVVSIIGTGGLGKTTLANAVYGTIEGKFPCTAFVSVSRKPNMKYVLRDLAQRVGITDDTTHDDERQLIDRLRGHLQDKRYLIVIDDIWSTQAWKTIGDALCDNDLGSRIITTTRNSTVASFCSSEGHVYRMKPLSPANSRRLFLERAFLSEDRCPPHLKEVSKRILEKCAGLPLAIITMSSFLADQTAEEEWNRALAAIGSSLANEHEAMTKILSLSYFDLPHPMRTCLLYLSAFPEDHIIQKQSLIHKWIAEGFIQGQERWSTYEQGECYFNELINRSLIQPASMGRGEEYGEVVACRVHDIILDFITCKAKEENFMTSFDDAEHEKKHKLRRLSIVRRNTEMATLSGDLSHIRSLVMFEDSSKNSLLDSPALREMDFPALRVLDLECWALHDHHLANIEKLSLLKYFGFGKTPFRTALPGGIGKLKYLETLDMRGFRIEKLPSTMTRLQRLSRLYATFTPTCLSDGIIGQLQSLEELENVHVSAAQEEKFLQELGQLTKLRMLSVTLTDDLDIESEEGDFERFVGNLRHSYKSHNPSFVGTLISSYTIQYLSITDGDGCTRSDPLSLESWRPANPAAFRKICINGYKIDKVPNWMVSLVNLRGLDLSMYRMGSEDVAILGIIPALIFLKLVTFYGRNGRILIRGFRSLKYFKLILKYCGTAVEFEEGSMPKLEHLELEFRAHKSKCVNYASDFGIQHLCALTKVDVSIGGKNDIIDQIHRLIEIALWKLRNRPTLSLHRREDSCEHIEEFVLSELLLKELYKEEAGISQQQIGASYHSFLGRLFEEINQDASPRRRMLSLGAIVSIMISSLSESDEEEDMPESDEEGYMSGSDEEEDMSGSEEEEAMNPGVLSKSDDEEDMNPSDADSGIHKGEERKLRVRTKRARDPASMDEEEDMHKNSGKLGGNDEAGNSVADTSAPFTFTATRHELDTILGGNSEGNDPVADTSAPFTFTATRHELDAILGGNGEGSDPVAHTSAPFTFTAMDRVLDVLQVSLDDADPAKRNYGVQKHHLRAKRARND